MNIKRIHAETEQEQEEEKIVEDEHEDEPENIGKYRTNKVWCHLSGEVRE